MHVITHKHVLINKKPRARGIGTFLLFMQGRSRPSKETRVAHAFASPAPAYTYTAATVTDLGFGGGASSSSIQNQQQLQSLAQVACLQQSSQDDLSKRIPCRQVRTATLQAQRVVACTLAAAFLCRFDRRFEEQTLAEPRSEPLTGYASRF